MSKNKRMDAGDAVQLIADQGREILHEGNRRRVIARYPDGKVLIDVSVTAAVAGILVIMMLLPFNWLILGGLAVFGISQKIRVDFVREVGSGDENATISDATNRRASRLSRDGDVTDGETVVEDKPKSKRKQD